jgi:phosphoribosylformylglycinamidine synthase
MDDVESHLTPWWKAEGDVIVLLGRTREELGASEYLAVVHGVVRGVPPWIDLEAEKRLHRACLAAASERVLRSLHAVGQGGLAVALAECCFGAAGLGARVALEPVMRMDSMLFAESQSRMVVSLRRRHLGRLRDLARREEVPFTVLGEVRGQSLVIGDVVDLPLEAARGRWNTALRRRLAAG